MGATISKGKGTAMRGKAMFLAGLAVGYVLGARAGREQYEKIVQNAQKIRTNPTVQEAAGMMQAQTTKMASSGREMMRGRMGDRFSNTKLGQSRVGQRMRGQQPSPSGTASGEMTPPGETATPASERPSGQAY